MLSTQILKKDKTETGEKEKDKEMAYREMSYNEEYYYNLSKKLVLPIINQSKNSEGESLLQMIVQNKNASISSTAGQLIDSFEEIVLHTKENKDEVKSIGKVISKIKEDVNGIESEVKEDYMEDVVYIKNEYSKYISIQSKENSKLQREVDEYTKEVNELQKRIYYLLGRINLLEREIGIKNKDYGYYEDNLIIGTEEARFIIKTEKL